MEFQLFSVKTKGLIFKSYEIYKEDQIKYLVKANAFVRQYTLFDEHGLELIQIKRPFSFFSFRFIIKKFDLTIAEVSKESKLFTNNLNIISANGTYFASGNFRANEFTILKNDEEVAKISRHSSFSNRQYGIAILDGEDELLILGIVMAIEMMIRVRRARKAG
jgi:uncharacterized protein YxjI